MTKPVRDLGTVLLAHAALVLGAACSVAFLLTASSDGQLNNDVFSTIAPAWNLAQHGTVQLTDTMAGLVGWKVEAGGHPVSSRFPGAILWATPFYALLGRHLVDSGDALPLFPGVLAAVCAATIAVTLLYRVLRHIAPARLALAATLLAAFATGTWTVSADSLWTHGVAQMCLGGAMLALANRRHAVAGAMFGAAILVRPHLGLVAATAGLYLLLRERSWRQVAAMGATTSWGVAALLAYNRVTFGAWSVLGGYDDHGFSSTTVGIRAFLVNVAGTAISPERGVLVMSPFLLMLLPWLWDAWRNAPTWADACALGGVTYLTAQLLLNRFSGGDGFYSYRLPLEALTLCAPLLLIAYRRSVHPNVRRRRVFGALAFVAVFLHALGAVVYAPVRGEHNPWTTFLPWSAIAGSTPAAVVALAVGSALFMALLGRLGRAANGSAAAQQLPEPSGEHVPAPLPGDPLAAPLPHESRLG
jgi:hypothetical protein